MTPVEALQETLAAEHAAVHVLGVLGGQVSTSESPALASRIRAAYVTHRGRRDHLRSTVAGLGETPVAAAPAYDVDSGAGTAADLSRAAAETEAACAEVYAQLTAHSTGRDRDWAVEALVDSSVRLLDLGGSPDPWPGLPEL